MLVADSLDVDGPELIAFCRRWKVLELAVFGSALREDLREDSNVDLLVAFDPDLSSD